MPTDNNATSGTPRGIFLTLRQISKTYQRGQETVEALRDCSLTFAPGQLTLVLGPSGGGKSTLLHLLGGMDRPTQGQILADHVDITALKANGLAQWRRRTIGFIFQNFYLLPKLTAEENVALPLLLDGFGRHERLSRAHQVLDSLGLSQRHRYTPAELSGGQIQRVAIGRALSHDAPVILADEPTGNLDTQSGQEIMGQLQALAHNDGRTVIVVTHNQEYAAMADRIIHIRDGRIEDDSQPVAPSAPTPPASTPRRGSGPNFLALLSQSLRSLGSRRARTIMTSVGVMIGVASMVLLISVGAGIQAKVVKAVTNNTSLTMMTVSPSAQSSSLGLSRTTTAAVKFFSPATIKSFSQLKYVAAAYGISEFLAATAVSGRSATLVIENLPPANARQAPKPPLLQGHYPESGTNGIILPRSTAMALFNLHQSNDLASVIGRRIRLSVTGSVSGSSTIASSSEVAPTTLVIRGIAKTSLESLTYINNNLANQWLAKIAGKGQPIHYSSAIVMAQNINHVASIAQSLRHQGYGVTSTQSVIRQIHHEFSIVETALGVIGGIALAVAGLMIAVVMSMAVLERRREIGVWRALGARRRDVFVLFLTEAVLVGLMGGLLGILVGWGLGKIGASLFHEPGLFLVPAWLAALGILFGGGIAALAGLIPANHAAQLRPVEALRSE